MNKIDDPTTADDILGRIVQCAFRIDLRGDSCARIRRNRSRHPTPLDLCLAERGKDVPLFFRALFRGLQEPSLRSGGVISD